MMMKDSVEKQNNELINVKNKLNTEINEEPSVPSFLPNIPTVIELIKGKKIKIKYIKNKLK